MKRLVLSVILALSAAQAQAQPPVLAPLISADQYSGFVPPQYRFTIHCELNGEGKLHSEISSPNQSGEWGVHEVIDRQLTPDELAQVNTLIDGARSGPFEHGHNPCDIGGLVITARVGNFDLALLASPDCGIRTTNVNPSAKKLMDWVRKECKLR